MKPGDVYLGVVELFSVFIPGLITFFLFYDDISILFSGKDALIIGIITGKIDSTSEYIAISIVAYIIGQILFAVGALVWDDIYDCIRKRVEPSSNPQSNGKEDKDILRKKVSRLVDKLLCALSYVIYYSPGKLQPLVDMAKDVRSKFTNNKADKPEDLNTYQWSRAVLAAKKSTSYQEILRKEADSKLFRSLLLPIVIIAIIQFWNCEFSTGIFTVFCFYLAYLGFSKQRSKGCKIAYTNVVTLYHIGELTPDNKQSTP